MKTRKILKIALLVIVAGIFIWTFVFLYQKSQPEVTLYDTVRPAAADLEKTTVVTGKIEPRDEVLIKPQISGIIEEVYKEAGQKVKKGEVIAKVKVMVRSTPPRAACAWPKSTGVRPKPTLPASRNSMPTSSSAPKSTRRAK